MVAAAAAIAALGATAASPASAGWVKAKFSGGPSVKATTTGVTLKRDGIEPKTCTLFSGATIGSISGSEVLGLANATVPGWGEPITRFECGGSNKLDLYTSIVQAEYETVSGQYRLYFWPWPFEESLQAPWSNKYRGAFWYATFTNGSGATPSSFTASEAVIGKEPTSGKKITMSGTFNLTDNKGGLVTVTP